MQCFELAIKLAEPTYVLISTGVLFVWETYFWNFAKLFSKLSSLTRQKAATKG